MIVAILPSMVQAPTAMIYCDPSMISGILPDDAVPFFDLEVRVSDVVDLWAAGFTIEYRPFVKAIVAVEVSQGDFLENDGFQTEFNSAVDTIAGEVVIGYSRLPVANTFPFGPLPPVGKDGSGLLATIRFKVISAGDSPITLTNVGLYDRDGVEMTGYGIGNSYFDGPTADLTRKSRWWNWWPWYVAGSSFLGTKTFRAEMKSHADVDLQVRAHWDMYRVEDNQRLEIFSGQSFSGFGPVFFEYLYVDEFNGAVFEWEGDPANVLGEPDGLYIEANDNALWAMEYGFQDLVLGDRLIGNIFLEGYVQYPGGPSDAADVDVYCINPVAFSWYGSLWGTETWGWHGVRWTTDSMTDAVPALMDEGVLNNSTVLVYAYHAEVATMRVDSMRMRVEFSKFVPVSPESFTLSPGAKITLPQGEWPLTDFDTGKWIAELKGEYRYGDTAWIPTDTVVSFTWWCFPKPWWWPW
jgi:hypothetical protein